MHDSLILFYLDAYTKNPEQYHKISFKILINEQFVNTILSKYIPEISRIISQNTIHNFN